MNDQLLRLEVGLLVLRHGRRSVLEALALAENQSLEALEREITALATRKTVRKPKPITTESVIAKAFAERPEVIPSVEALVRDYENKTFLPHLRDVQRFIDRVGGPRGRLKSRSTALHQLIKALAKMRSDEIAELTRPSDRSDQSDYELLAREIMGTSTASSRPDRSDRDIESRNPNTSITDDDRIL